MKTVFNHVSLYVESTPDKKYRQNPLTYLNQKSFNNEIIDNSNEGNKSKGVSTKYREAWEKANEGGNADIDMSQY